MIAERFFEIVRDAKQSIVSILLSGVSIYWFDTKRVSDIQYILSETAKL